MALTDFSSGCPAFDAAFGATCTNVDFETVSVTTAEEAILYGVGAMCVRAVSSPAAPAERFVETSVGTVYDRLTGLEWEKTPSSDSAYWLDALAICEAKPGAWRLPDVRELSSLLDFGKQAFECPLLDPLFSPTCSNGEALCWTSTPRATDATRACFVDLGKGHVDHFPGLDGDGYWLGAWCVTGGPAITDPDGDGIQSDGDGSGTPGDAPCVDGVTADCDDNCPGVANADQADSDGDGLGNSCDTSLDVVSDGFGQGPAEGCYWDGNLQGSCFRYWSLSLRVDNTDDAWFAGFSDGLIDFGVANTTAKENVRCVRTGP